MFDFNASLIDVAPLSPIPFPFDYMRMEKSRLLMYSIYVLFLLFLQSRSSFISVVFDFNASLKDVAPVSPMSLSVYLMIKEKEWIVDGFHLCVCAH